MYDVLRFKPVFKVVLEGCVSWPLGCLLYGLIEREQGKPSENLLISNDMTKHFSILMESNPNVLSEEASLWDPLNTYKYTLLEKNRGLSNYL